MQGQDDRVLRQDKRLIADLKYLAKMEGWTDEEKRFMWQETVRDHRLIKFWHDLAENWRTGKPVPVLG
jgi:hypothetical protein